MAFDLDYFVPLSGMGNSNVQRVFYYEDDTDVIATIIADDYFLDQYAVLNAGDKIVVKDGADGFFELLVTASTASTVTVVAVLAQELTATGAVTAGVKSVELNHASVVVEATIADSKAHQGLFVVKDTSATGTSAHTLTLTAGTFNGTNNVATLNALNECLVVWFDSAGNGTIVENVGSVGLS